MFIKEQLEKAGEYPFFFDTAVGQMEALLLVPKNFLKGYFAVLGHPHSLHGGTMHNKVVTILGRAFHEKGIPSIRFNFRGVGCSSGHFDKGIGESLDMLQLVQHCLKLLPGTQFFLAGFSFGAYVTYRAAQAIKPLQLISVGPPVTRFDFKEYDSVPQHWDIIQGTEDEVISEQDVSAFVHSFVPPLSYKVIEASHFFHGKLIALKNTVMDLIHFEQR